MIDDCVHSKNVLVNFSKCIEWGCGPGVEGMRCGKYEPGLQLDFQKRSFQPSFGLHYLIDNLPNPFCGHSGMSNFYHTKIPFL